MIVCNDYNIYNILKCLRAHDGQEMLTYRYTRIAKILHLMIDFALLT